VSLWADGSTIAIGHHIIIIIVMHCVKWWSIKSIVSEGSSWERLVQSTIHGDNAGDMSRRFVSLFPDGNTLEIGSKGDWEEDDRPGYVRVFPWRAPSVGFG